MVSNGLKNYLDAIKNNLKIILNNTSGYFNKWHKPENPS